MFILLNLVVARLTQCHYEMYEKSCVECQALVFSFLQENSVTFEKWKTSVWKEGIFGFHQVSPEVATDSVFATIGHPRFKITTYVCTGDQVQLSDAGTFLTNLFNELVGGHLMHEPHPHYDNVVSGTSC